MRKIKMSEITKTSIELEQKLESLIVEEKITDSVLDNPKESEDFSFNPLIWVAIQDLQKRVKLLEGK